MPDMPFGSKILGQLDDFTLFELPSPPEGGWRPLKLVANRRHGRSRKQNWWLGWSDHEQRLSGSHAHAHLRAHLPRILDWVKTCLVTTSKSPAQATRD
jgi:hypothetical protein